MPPHHVAKSRGSVRSFGHARAMLSKVTVNRAEHGFPIVLGPGFELLQVAEWEKQT